MRSIPDSQAIAMIAIMSLLTFFVRGLPFLLFSGKSKTPAYIMYLGKVLPYAIIGMLVVYCFKNVSLLQTPFGLPELIAILFIVVLHKWKKSTLLSIGGGTVFYMVLVQTIFG